MDEIVKLGLEEMCKQDNVNIDDYLAEHNKTRTVGEYKSLNTIRDIRDESRYSPKMTYGMTDRFNAVWMVLKNLKYSFYRPFDFSTYPEYTEDIDSYYVSSGVKTKISTPWKRFKSFIKAQWNEIKWAWNFTPEHIKHYKNNKSRIDWFGEHVSKYFFSYGKEATDTKKKLLDLGYNVTDNNVYYDQSPKMRRK